MAQLLWSEYPCDHRLAAKSIIYHPLCSLVWWVWLYFYALIYNHYHSSCKQLSFDYSYANLEDYFITDIEAVFLWCRMLQGSKNCLKTVANRRLLNFLHFTYCSYMVLIFVKLGPQALIGGESLDCRSDAYCGFTVEQPVSWVQEAVSVHGARPRHL